MKKIINAAFLFTLCFGMQQASAQFDPMASIYFQNQYLGNPAMAGLNDKINLNLSYRKQWSNIPGSPSAQALTGDYGVSRNVGVGAIIYNDKAGLFKRTRAVGTYAYHVPLNLAMNQRLSFGLSLGFMNERLSDEDIVGDLNDINVRSFDNRKTYIDSDFGIAYTSNKLTIQAMLPNLKNVFKKDIATNVIGRSTFLGAVGYKFAISDGANGFGLEPKAVYRGVQGFDDIVDVGANVSYAGNKINFFGMYHSTKSNTFGLSINYNSFGFLAAYTSATSALSNFANGDFEFGVKLML